MNRLARNLMFPSIVVLYIAGSFRISYMSLAAAAGLSVAFLLTLYGYLNYRYQISIHPGFLMMLLAAVVVDPIGNHFRLYDREFGSIPYDTFAHFITPALAAPAMVYGLWKWNERCGCRMPLGAMTFFAVASTFSLAGFYELVEYWDELYLGGKRITSAYDTSKDLQWGLAGAAAGATATHAVLSRLRNKRK